MSRKQQRFQMGAAEARVQAAILAPIGDASSLDGAKALKQRIEGAWLKRGVAPPKIKIRERGIMVGGETITRFELWSNMKNGLPV